MVDADEQVREDAHQLLERYGCVVETAQKGAEAVMMVRSSGGSSGYDVIISDIRLPDFSGYQLMLRLGDIIHRVPMVLMTGFGYDPWTFNRESQAERASPKMCSIQTVQTGPDDRRC